VSHAEAWENLKRAAKSGLAFADIERLVEEWVRTLPPELKRLGIGSFTLGVTKVEDIPKRFREDPEFREAFLSFLRAIP